VLANTAGIGMDHFTVVTDRLAENQVLYERLSLAAGARPGFGIAGPWFYVGGRADLHVVAVSARPALRRDALDPMACTWQVFFLDLNGAEVEIDFDAAQGVPAALKNGQIRPSWPRHHASPARGGRAGCGSFAMATMLVGIGIGVGTEFDVAACMMARHFGMRDCGRLFGAHLGTITLAATLAPLLTGAVHQSSGGCNTVLTLCGAASLSGVLLMLPLVRHPRFE
jgi:hypothetical protein